MYKIYPGPTRNTVVFSYGIYIPFCPQPSKTLLGRFLDSYYHNDKVAPFHRITARLLIIYKNLKTIGRKVLDVYHQTTVLYMEKLHRLTAAADENKYISVPDTASHVLMHHSTEGTDTFAISPARAKNIIGLMLCFPSIFYSNI